MQQRRPRIIGFAILTTITILTWIGFDVWRAFNRPVPTEVESRVLEELDPTFDQEVVATIRNRRFFSDEEARTAIPQSSPAPTVTPSPSPSSQATGSAQITTPQ